MSASSLNALITSSPAASLFSSNATSSSRHTVTSAAASSRAPTMSAEVQTPPQAKYTRYRSVRKASTAQPPPPPPPPPPAAEALPKPVDYHNPAIQRSRSRYHRRPTLQSPSQNVPLPAFPNNSPQLPHAQTPKLDTYDATRDTSLENKPLHYQTVISLEAQQDRGQNESPQSSRVRQTNSHNALLGAESQGGSRSDLRQTKISRLTGEDNAARILEEQKRKDLERLEKELSAAAARPSIEASSTPASRPGDRFGNLLRKRALSKTALSKSSSSEAESDTKSEGIGHELAIKKSQERSRETMKVGGGVVPGIDAPKSAVNAGERRVLVRCKQCSINLPVNPETTPVDLMNSAANILTISINPSASILLESYTKLGLERRIRRYEHVRDILNSWDRDTQNALVIEASDSPGHDYDLEAACVPKVQPIDIQVYMYHSLRPGKWNKRYITLLSTGQIFTSKKKDAKVSDKDILTLCHLTDFDIYAPTTQEIRKNLRPPKKYCYTIKSQQKTNMFLDTEKFVHFFSTDDYSMATKWHDACQQWRSWYLVNMMGEGAKKAKPQAKSIKVEDFRTEAGGKSVGHKIRVSADDDPYMIGSFKPLLDASRFDTDDEDDENRPRQIPFHLRHGTPPVEPPPTRRERNYPPPVSLPRHLQQAAGSDYTSPTDSSTSAFAPSSLLGRTYSQRQRAQKEREASSNANQGPFIPGPSLLNNGRPSTSTGSRATTDYSREPLPPTPTTRSGESPRSSPHRRANSIATRRPTISSDRRPTLTQPPKPLIDLSPKFVEARQWSKEGKGHGVAAPLGVPLVEVAKGGMENTAYGIAKPEILFRRDAAR